MPATNTMMNTARRVPAIAAEDRRPPSCDHPVSWTHPIVKIETGQDEYRLGEVRFGAPGYPDAFASAIRSQ
jgi:hypothetical protein